jgi:PEGA domain-containing protein
MGIGSKARQYFVASLAVVLFADTAAVGQAPAPPPSPASTASGLGESLTGPAKDAYEAARILFDSGDYAGALVKFQHAFDLSSDVRLLWDMGACEKNLRHYVHVLNLIERYLHDGDALITETQRADAAAVVRTVRALVSSMRLIVNEPGAAVFVDDEAIGTTPLAEPLRLDLGDRRLRVSKPGFKDQTFTQHVVGASELTLSVALEREAPGGRQGREQAHEGQLTVSADEGATIRIDGAVMGVGNWEGPLAVGGHVVGVTAPGMVAYSSSVVVHEGESRTLDVTLQHESGGVSALWWIGGAVVAAAGLGVGSYFLLRGPTQTQGPVTEGTISPGTITIQPGH